MKTVGHNGDSKQEHDVGDVVCIVVGSTDGSLEGVMELRSVGTNS